MSNIEGFVRGRRGVMAAGGVVAVAAIAAALAAGGAANASGDTAVDPSIRQLSGKSWIAEDTFLTPIDNDSQPTPMIEEGGTVDPDSDMLPSGPASMIEEGSSVDPDSDMLGGFPTGQL